MEIGEPGMLANECNKVKSPAHASGKMYICTAIRTSVTRADGGRVEEGVDAGVGLEELRVEDFDADDIVRQDVRQGHGEHIGALHLQQRGRLNEQLIVKIGEIPSKNRDNNERRQYLALFLRFLKEGSSIGLIVKFTHNQATIHQHL